MWWYGNVCPTQVSHEEEIVCKLIVSSFQKQTTCEYTSLLFLLFCFISDKQKHVCVCTKNKEYLTQTLAHLIGGFPASLARLLKGKVVVDEVVEIVEST